MSKIYYGAKEIPKGKRRANMKEAVEAGQIRYWGAKKVDPIIINAIYEQTTQTAQIKKKITTLQTSIIQSAGKIKKLTASLPYVKSEAEKKPILTEISKLQADIKTKKAEVNSLQ